MSKTKQRRRVEDVIKMDRINLKQFSWPNYSYTCKNVKA